MATHTQTMIGMTVTSTVEKHGPSVPSAEVERKVHDYGAWREETKEDLTFRASGGSLIMVCQEDETGEQASRYN